MLWFYGATVQKPAMSAAALFLGIVAALAFGHAVLAAAGVLGVMLIGLVSAHVALVSFCFVATLFTLVHNKQS